MLPIAKERKRLNCQYMNQYMNQEMFKTKYIRIEKIYYNKHWIKSTYDSNDTHLIYYQNSIWF